MKKYKHKIAGFILIIAALQLVSCNKQASNYEKIEPAHLDHVEGSELMRLTLTEKAIERVDIKTDQIKEEAITDKSGKTSDRMVTPHGSVIYDAFGHIWLYTNPEPRVFVRNEIKIDFIQGDKVVLNECPPVGTAVVVQGAAELYGTEYEVGH